VVLSETPGLSLGEVGKALGARWKAIDPEDKAAFEQKAKEAKAKYEVVLKAGANQLTALCCNQSTLSGARSSCG